VSIVTERTHDRTRYYTGDSLGFSNFSHKLDEAKQLSATQAAKLAAALNARAKIADLETTCCYEVQS
jgi:hypothetical protein